MNKLGGGCMLMLCIACRVAHTTTTGALVFGCHLQTDGWESIVWGIAPDQLGRLPRAALLAWEERSTVRKICFGTGASSTTDEILEGEYTLSYLLSRIPRLAEFRAFEGVPLEELEMLLKRVCVAETSSKSTDEEASHGLGVLAEAGCTRVTLISSPTHLPRCLASAMAVAEREPALRTLSLWASPSDTCYEGFSASDVAVVEPPHRGDRDRSLDKLPFHEMIRRCFAVPAEQRHAFLRQFERLLESHGV